MGEQVMVVSSVMIDQTFGLNPTNIIHVSEETFISLVESHYSLVDRDMAESNKNYRQIVSYCVIKCKDEVFITQRTVKQTEKRLHNLFSLGIGGHISAFDIYNCNIVYSGMLRELFEEVDIQCVFDLSFVGIINDDSSDVNSVHTGLCYLVETCEKKCTVRETEKLRGGWIKESEITEYYDRLEAWSKIVVRSLRGF